MSSRPPGGTKSIRAAQAIYDLSAEWKAADAALRRLRLRWSDVSRQTVLIRIAALNDLYGANVMVPYRLPFADHVARVMSSKRSPSLPPVDLVNTLANLESPKRTLLSAAAKYAHFFVDEQRHPILDRHAALALNDLEIAEDRVPGEGLRRYGRFITRFKALQAANPKFDVNALDRYLWVKGQLLEAGDTKKTSNSELQRLRTSHKNLFAQV